MENWNWQQIIGFALMFTAGIVCVIGGLILLYRFLKPEIAGGIMTGIMLISGFAFWKYGLKKNKSSVNNKN